MPLLSNHLILCSFDKEIKNFLKFYDLIRFNLSKLRSLLLWILNHSLFTFRTTLEGVS